MTIRSIALAGLLSLCSFFSFATTEHTSFESNFGNFSQVGQFNFTRKSGTTSSSNTGPSGGANGSSYYAYMETSGGSANSAGNYAELRRANIQADVMTFYYHMYGSNTGTLNVKVYYNGTWSTVWSKSGQQHTSTTKPWTKQTIDLSMFEGTISVSFEAIAAGGYMGDIAIDEISFDDQPTHRIDFESNLGIFYNDAANSSFDLAIHTGTTSSSDTGPSGGANGTNKYVYFETSSGSAYSSGNAGVLRTDSIEGDFIKFYYHMFGDNIGKLALEYSYNGSSWNSLWEKQGQQHVSSSDAWTQQIVEIPKGLASIRFYFEATGGYKGDIAIDEIEFLNANTPDLSTDFQQGLDWTNTGDFKWLRTSGTTPSGNTGPSSGASGSSSDFYAFLESSSGYAFNYGDIAILESQSFTSMYEVCFSVHMYGSDMGSLTLEALDQNNNWQRIKKYVGQQQSQTTSAWLRECQPLEAGYQKLRFVGEAAGGFKGDMAIDDISVIGSDRNIDIQYSSTSGITYEDGGEAILSLDISAENIESVYFKFTVNGDSLAEEEWRLATVSINDDGVYYVNLGQLPPGDYDLLFKVVQENGTTSIEGIDEFRITKSSPTSLVIDDTQYNYAFSKSHNDAAGYTKGRFSVSPTGGATYSIPVSLPKGVYQATPNLSINYASGGRNGLMGKGWSVSGAPSITRCGRSYTIDSEVTPIQWNSADRFCLNGRQLVLESGTYGVSGSKYVTEIEQHMTVTLYNNPHSGTASYFILEDKSGYKQYFGSSANSKDVNSNNNLIYQWGVARKQDLANNDIFYYYNNTANEFYLTSVEYSDDRYSVSFNVEDRLDPYSIYIAGHRRDVKVRYKNIEVSAFSGTRLLRSYEFEYEPFSSNDIHKLTKLSSITECSADACYKPTKFEWTDVELGPPSSSNGTTIQASYVTGAGVADVNGDGITDLVLQNSSGANSTSCTLKTYLGSVNGLNTNPVESKSTVCDYHGVPNVVQYRSLMLNDINGDGRADHNGFVTSYDSSSDSWKTYKNNADDGFIKTNYSSYVLTGNAKDEDSFKVVDLNGDGLSDYIEWADADWRSETSIDPTYTYSWTEASQVRVYLAQMNSEGDVTLDKTKPYVFNLGTELNANYMSFGDFNGDGLPELVVHDYFIPQRYLTQPNRTYRVIDFPDFTSTSQSVSTLATFSAPAGQVLIGDINGDGLSDVVADSYDLAEDGDPDGGHRVYYYVNDGVSSVYSLTELSGLGLDEQYQTQISLGDYNQDGFQDLNFETVTWLWDSSSETFVDRNIESDFYNNPIQADFNGDGRLDVLTLGVKSTTYHSGSTYNSNYYTNPTIYTNTNSSELPNRIKSITNGLGYQTKIDYENIASSDHYLPLDVGVSNSYIDDIRVDFDEENAETAWRAGISSTTNFYSLLRAGPTVPELTNGYESDHLNEEFAYKPVTGGMAVVTRVTTTNPYALSEDDSIDISKTSTKRYYYGQGLYQARRGFVGFAAVTEVDSANSIETQTIYRQDYPFNGRAVLQQVRTSGGNTLSTTYTNWRMNRSGSATTGTPIYPYQVFADYKITTSYDPNSGAAIKFEQTTTSLTDDGHVDTSLTDLRDKDYAFVKSVESKFTYDTGCSVCVARGLPETKRVTNKVPDADNVIVTKYTESTFEYYENESNGWNGQLKSETFEPNRSAYTYTKSYEYDDTDTEYGNLVKETLSASGEVSRVNRYQYTGGRHIKYKYNAKNHLYEEVVTVNDLGQPTLIKGLNGVETTIAYDSFGVKYFESSNDGNWTASETQLCDEIGVTCPIGAAKRIKHSQASGALSFEYKDMLGRTVRTSKVGFDGYVINADSYFNNQGLLKYQSEPFFDGDTPTWTVYTYDSVKRKVRTHNPDGSSRSIAYNDFTKVYTNELSQQRTEVRDVIGQLIEVADHDGGRVQNIYGPFGNLESATSLGSLADPHDIVVDIGYDAIGRKTSMDDPDKGQWEYRYNKYGELEFQKNANLETTENFYDELGRQVKRIDRQSENGTILHTTVWAYDGQVPTNAPSRSGSALGQLTGVVHNAGNSTSCGSLSEVCHTFSHDSLGRLESETRRLGNGGSDGTYTTEIVYDEIGRIQKDLDVLSTSSLNSGVYYHFNQFGYPLGISNISGNNLEGVYRLDEMNARGQVKRSTRGNMAESSYTYNELTGRIEQQLAEHSSSSYPVQKIDYTWDKIGNLKTRSNYSGRNSSGYTYGALEETFCYDNLNRIELVEQGLNGSCSASNQYTYDSIGNIKYKVGVGTYTYSKVNAGPHAVTKTSVGNISYQYDNNGNLISDGKGRSLQYTVFDKPEIITMGSHTTRIYYGAERERWKRVETDTSTGETTTTLYLGSVEKVHTTRPNISTTEWQRYLGDFALFSKKSHTQSGSTTNTTEEQYVYKDYQGTTDVITNENAAIVTLMGFDVFGNRRDGYDGGYMSLDELKEVIDQQLASFVPTYSLTTKGYTGHEMLDEVGLIHMNGRVYNPTIGRFVSADPLIPHPDSTQSYNRYSYVQNRPMFSTDPSGFEDANDEEETLEIEINGKITIDKSTGDVSFEGEITVVSSGDIMKVSTSNSLTEGSVTDNGEQSDKTHQIDFKFISKLEGELKTNGYVPNAEGSKSGVTISTGVDLGARNKQDLKKLGLSKELSDKLTPYLGLKKSEAKQYLKENPLTITSTEAKQLYEAVKQQQTDTLIKLYNKASNKNFEDIPAKWQTIIASKFYQYGTGAPKFWGKVTKQDWSGARNELINFGDVYKTRRRKEVRYLDKH